MSKVSWQGIPYYPINQYYKERFGEKVYKLSVSVPGSCPNREGIGGMKPCNFCDEWGSAAFPEYRTEDIFGQIEKIKEVVRIRNKVNKFLLYFQAYTSTYKRTNQLRDYFEKALSIEDICGFVLGTRPDCISENLFDLLNEYQKIKPMFIELGVQSFNEDALIWMSRGHTGERSIWAIDKLKAKCPDLNIGIHLIFGLPNETDQDVIDTAKLVNTLGISNVKLHNMHVLKNTPLEAEFGRGEFTPLEIEDYTARVSLFLQYLDKNISVQRLTAVASRHDELISPRWTSSKMESYQYVIDYLKNRSIHQGQKLL